MNTDLIVSLIKIISINYVVLKIIIRISKIPKEDVKIWKTIIFIVIGSSVYLLARKHLAIDESIMYLIIAQAFFIKVLFNKTISESVCYSTISILITYILFIIIVPIAFMINLKLFYNNKIVNAILASGLVIGFLNIVFRMKRFNNKFGLFTEKMNYEVIQISIILISIITMILYNMIITGDWRIVYRLYIYVIILGGALFILIQHTLTLIYKQKILQKTIDDYEKQLNDKDEQIKKLSDDKFQISKLNHEFDNRLQAMMFKINNMNYESAEENNLNAKVLELSKEYSNKLEKIKTDFNLPKTGIEEIDDMFLYMASECKKQDIDFILQINGNINYLINNIIDKTKLVTLIGDHLKDAIIAVNCSENKFRNVLTVLGIKDTYYEFCVYDSGIEFEIDILEKLGIEPITTHKDKGGSGIGFITTFETLEECKASFELEEIGEPKENSYTKAVKFIFDGNKELRLKTYRKIKSKRFKINE